MFQINGALYYLILTTITQIMVCNTVLNHQPTLSWQVYNTLPNVPNKPALGYAGPVVGINNEKLLVAGGANFPNAMPWLGGKKEYYDEAYVMSATASSNDFEKFTLPYKVGYAASVSTPQGIVCIGGEDEKGSLSNVLLIQYNSHRLNYISLPKLPLAITNAAAATFGNIIYVAGGETASAVSDQFFKIDLTNLSKGWQTLADIPQAVSHSVFVSVEDDGKLYLIGGRKKSNEGVSELYSNTFQYNIHTNKWEEKAPMPYALSAGTGALVSNNYIAMFGGDKGETFHQTEQLINAINKEPDSAKRSMLNDQKIQLQSQHPGFSNEILLYDINKNKWSVDGTIPFPVAVTTTAIKHGNKIWIPSGEIKAGVRTPQILQAIIK